MWSADIMLGQVHENLRAIPRSEISSVHVGAAKSWQPMTITLTDGRQIEVQARGGLYQFVKAFD